MEKIAVIGLGYVGLPLACLCAKKGYDVVGLENKQNIVDLLKAGKSHIVDHEVKKSLAEAHSSGLLFPTSNNGDISDCKIYLICVPTPVNENLEPDLSPLLSAISSISPFIKKGDIVVVESTVFPGTCETIVQPLLEKNTGMKVGDDIHLGHCPERVNPGDAFWTTENIPRVVGATTTVAVELVAEFYRSILGGDIFDVQDIRASLRPKFQKSDGSSYQPAVVPLGGVTKMRSIRDAEAVKAMENTVRDVNIAFVNELAKISNVLKLDVVDIIDGMSTKPFGKGPFYPGIGVGGHCIAVDPEWLKAASKKAGYAPEIIELSRKTSNGMPQYAIDLLQDALNDCSMHIKENKITLLGVSYKKNIDDKRESPFFEIRKILEKKGASICTYDSWVADESTVNSLEEALSGASAVILITDHDDLVSELIKLNLNKYGIKVIVDGRNCLDKKEILSQGVKYIGIGR
ncbi:MAG: UDP-N-acetyl-D-glucosamine dehydrogenase [Colwellia sp.]|jgi:UDP-N-acetyl-D-glucosamine dehydrogenase